MSVHQSVAQGSSHFQTPRIPFALRNEPTPIFFTITVVPGADSFQSRAENDHLRTAFQGIWSVMSLETIAAALELPASHFQSQP